MAKGLLIFHTCLALFAKTTETRHETQRMVTPLSSFITKFMAVLATTLRDKDAFWRYVVINKSLRVTKFLHLCLVSPKNHLLSQASVKCQQTL